MLISLCRGRFERLGLSIDTYLTGANGPRDFKFTRVVRSRYLVSLYIFYVLLNVRDKNPLYGISCTQSLSLVKVLACLIFALILDQEYNFALTFD